MANDAPFSRESVFPPVAADGYEAVGDGRRLTADVVIVGTGPGGAAAARVLAEGGLKVVLLEEGPSSSQFKPNQANTMRYHMQEGGMIVAQGSALLSIAAGRGVGGGTLINCSALSFQPSDDVLDEWGRVLDDLGRTGPVHRWASIMMPRCAADIGVADTSRRGLLGRTIASLTAESRRWASTVDWPPKHTARCVGCGI